jgi:hypothetical protein
MLEVPRQFYFNFKNQYIFNGQLDFILSLIRYLVFYLIS